MARPLKKGLDYFPFDTDFLSDSDIKGMTARFGPAGIALYIYTLCEIYRDEGYYKILTEDFEFIASMDVGVPSDKVSEILQYIYKRRLLVRKEIIVAGEAVSIITSAGVQKRYQLAVSERARRRGIVVNPAIWVLPKNETAAFIAVSGDVERINRDKSRINEDKYFENPAVEEAFCKYLSFRDDLTEEQITALKDKLISLSADPAEQAAIIQEATIHGWRSFYEKDEKEKPERNKSGKKKPAFYSCEQRERDYKALEAELVGRTAEETKGGNDAEE